MTPDRPGREAHLALRKTSSASAVDGEPTRTQELLQELAVHRAQLEAQSARLSHNLLELAHAQERCFELYELAPIGYVSLDGDGVIVRANLEAGALLGLPRGELLGRRLVEFASLDAVQACREVVEKGRRLGKRESQYIRFSRRLAAPVELQLVVMPSTGTFTGAEGNPFVTLYRCPDAPSVRTKQAELGALCEAVSDAVLVVDDKGSVTTCNDAALRLFGRTRGELLGRPIVGLIQGFPMQATARRVERSARSASGELLPVEVAVRTAERSLVAVVTDLRERRREQSERLEALLRFNDLAGSVEEAFYVASAATGRSSYVSPAFERIFGRPLVAHEGEPWPRLAWIHPEDRERVSDAADALRAGGLFDLEYRLLLPSGEERWVRDRAFFLEDRSRLGGVLRDVTRERRLAEELNKAQRLEAMGTLASSVAHDFNNLLMGIGGCVQLALRRVAPSDPAHGYLHRAADAVLRGANLSKQILRIGDTRRVHGGNIVLDDVVLGARELLVSLVGESVTVTILCGAEGIRVAGAAADIEQILINLASNARDAMPGGGELTLATAPEGDRVTLSVRDTGVGMSATVKARVFEPFFTTKREGKGTGLGLATVFALVRRLGGSVGLESAEGRGTTVSMALPVVDRVPRSSPPESSPPPRGGETVLVVDDDPLVRLTVENHLQALGYRAISASNADEAMGFCEDETLSIDLVISDVMMPGLLGPELLQKLRQRNKQFPVLFMSAYPPEELVDKAHVELGACVLAKPFDASALGEALYLAFESARRGGQRRRVLVVDDNEDITDVLSELLALENDEVVVANSPSEALLRAPEARPEVVLCDLDLGGGMTGYELVSTLRKDPRLASTHFVALTGRSPAECRERAADAGFVKILTKPVEPATLKKTLRKLGA